MIAVNTSFRLAPWADVLYGCDASWWQHYFAEVATTFRGSEMWTVASAARDQYKLRWVYGYDSVGLSKSADKIHTGYNSGYQAIGLAALWGASRILLLGFDFQRTNGKTHWHGDHPRTLGNGGRYPMWIKAMDALAKDARTAGIDIANCSRKSALKCFRISTIDTELSDIPKYTQQIAAG